MTVNISAISEMYSEMSKVGYPFLQISFRDYIFSKAASKHKYHLKKYEIRHQNFTRSLHFLYLMLFFQDCHNSKIQTMKGIYM
jgi:hypothetical protein